MSIYIFEPGHTEACFRARHMMVTWVTGAFKDIHGRIDFDADDPVGSGFEGGIDAGGLWTGEAERDEHLRSADFFDVENHPRIEFRGAIAERTGDTHYKAEAELTIRGETKPVVLDVTYQGRWRTAFWDDGENKGEMRRIGFAATGKLNRHDFGVSWQDELPGGGLVVSNEIRLALNVEAIHEGDLRETGAISYYE